MVSYSEKIQFLADLRVHLTRHSGGTLLDHLLGVYLQLKQWGRCGSTCEAGLFHSVYGTEQFPIQTLTSDARSQVASMLGNDTENLVYLFCSMDRTHYIETVPAKNDTPPRTLVHRTIRQELPLSPEEHRALAYMILANWYEHLPRTDEDHRYGKAPLYAPLIRYLNDPILTDIIPAEYLIPTSFPSRTASGAN